MTHIPEPGDILKQMLDRIANGPEYAAKAIREQRRYEIAKECLAGMMSPNMLSFCSANTPHYVRYSIELADALLAELEKKP